MEDIIKDTLTSYTGRINRYRTNAPAQYSDRKHQYYADETRLFVEQYDRFSSDYVDAMVQGLNPGDPYGYTKVHLRLSNVITSTSAVNEVYDNYKRIEIAEKQYAYIRRGAKVVTMGNTWLVTNPNNMSGITGQAVIQRCDATWNHLDYYGNVVSEPVCIDRLDMRGVDPDSQRSTMINTGYYSVKLQYNADTMQLGNNSRLFLGDSAYIIAGYAEISREFTFEEDSVRLMVFRAMAEEPNAAVDDLVNKVAGGKTFSWSIAVSGESAVKVGESVQLSAESIRTSEEHSEVVVSTAKHPISYGWIGSEDGSVEVSPDGTATGIYENANHSATITCYLIQNPSIRQEFTMDVQDGSDALDYLGFTTTLPKVLRMYQTVTITAYFYSNGEPDPLSSLNWAFSGADPASYEITDQTNNSVTVKCWSGSVEPLEIHVKCGGETLTGMIELEGI